MARTVRPVFALLVLFAVAPGARAQPAQIGGPLPSQILPVDNWWNLAVTGYSVSPNDSTWHMAPNTNAPLHPDWGGDVMPAPFTYGIPYVTVPGTQPMVVLDSTQFDYPEQSDYQAPGRPPGYPIPPEAITQPKWIEGGLPGNDPSNIAQNNDQHMLIVDRDNLILYELYHTYYNGSWHAGSGAIWPLGSNMRRPDGWTSADASGIQLLPGLVRFDEVMSVNPINHALRYTLSPIQQAHVYPASHTACNPCNANSPPMGARIRLKSSFNITTHVPPFEAHVQKVLQAMKTYGMILTDGGTSGYVTGDYNNHWLDVANVMTGDTWLDIFHDQFLLVHLSDFEYVVDPGGTQASGNDRMILTSVSPATKCQGNAGFPLTVNLDTNTGSFINGSSTVKFNGLTRATTFMSVGQLQATILASDLLTAGDALVSVTDAPDPDVAPLRLTITADGTLPTVTSPAAATVIQTLCQ